MLENTGSPKDSQQEQHGHQDQTQRLRQMDQEGNGTLPAWDDKNSDANRPVYRPDPGTSLWSLSNSP